MALQKELLIWVVLIVSLGPTPSMTQRVDIDWAAEGPTDFGTRLTLSAADKRDVVRLAAQLGLTSPVRVAVDHLLPTLCEFVRVDSAVRPEGNHLVWLELRIRPREWRACVLPENGATVRRVGRWISGSSDLYKRSLWRVHGDETWSIDVELDDDAMHGDAEIIVRAIGQGKLVNRVPAIELGEGKRLEIQIPEVNATEVSAIHRDPKVPGGYTVVIGKMAGAILSVRIANGVVEVYAISSRTV